MKFLERFWLGCGHCHGAQSCPLADKIDPAAVAAHEYGHGSALAAAVILVFLLPMVAAIVGAYLAGQWLGDGPESLLKTGQVGGAVVGFFVGVGVAKLVFWTRARLASAGGGAE